MCAVFIDSGSCSFPKTSDTADYYLKHRLPLEQIDAPKWQEREKGFFSKNRINWIRFKIHKPKNAYFLIFTSCCNVYDICYALIAGQVIYNYYRCSLHWISWMLKICFFFLSFFVFCSFGWYVYDIINAISVHNFVININ